MMTLWVEFIICSGAVIISGAYLAKYGDIIAEKSGLGRTWIGLILMASVTSLPELVNGISSVTIANAPDIAIGDLMGSCIFNLSIIALMDIMHGSSPIFSKAENSHLITAGFGTILIGIATVSILAGIDLPSFGRIGAYTPLVILIYPLAIRSIFLFEKRKAVELSEVKAQKELYAEVPVSKAVFMYAFHAAIIVLAAIFLPIVGNKLANATGLGGTFFGTFFIGMTTSLPELIVSIAALRIGATDLAIANMLGSNVFNMLILGIDDLFYEHGPLLTHVSKTHAVTGTIAMIMTGIAIVSLTYRLKRKTVLRIGWDAIAILIAYFVSIVLLYILK